VQLVFIIFKKQTWNYDNKLIVISLGSWSSLTGKHRNLLETLDVNRIVVLISRESIVESHISKLLDVSWIEKVTL